TSRYQPMMVMLTGRPGPRRRVGAAGAEACVEYADEAVLSDGGGGVPATAGRGAKAIRGVNCSLTLTRLKKTNHQMPIPSCASANTNMNTRITTMKLAMNCGSTRAPGGVGGAGMASMAKAPSKENRPNKASSAAKTIIEMRAQWRRRNKPMLVVIPQAAG